MFNLLHVIFALLYVIIGNITSRIKENGMCWKRHERQVQRQDIL